MGRGQADKHTDGHVDSLTNSAQRAELVKTFTELALQGQSVSKLQCLSVVCMSVCVSVCVIAEPRFLIDWKLLIKGYTANIGIPLDVFGFLLFP